MKKKVGAPKGNSNASKKELAKRNKIQLTFTDKQNEEWEKAKEPQESIQDFVRRAVDKVAKAINRKKK